MLRVFLVDDHEVVRRGVADLLDEDSCLEVVGEAATVAEALVRIPAAAPDVAVLDVRLPDGNGVELCRELRSRIPGLACLMLTSFSDEQAMLDAILAGAAGYVLKDIRGSDLIGAVYEVGAGRSLLDNRAAQVLMAKLRADAAWSAPTFVETGPCVSCCRGLPELALPEGLLELHRRALPAPGALFRTPRD